MGRTPRRPATESGAWHVPPRAPAATAAAATRRIIGRGELDRGEAERRHPSRGHVPSRTTTLSGRGGVGASLRPHSRSGPRRLPNRLVWRGARRHAQGAVGGGAARARNAGGPGREVVLGNAVSITSTDDAAVVAAAEGGLAGGDEAVARGPEVAAARVGARLRTAVLARLADALAVGAAGLAVRPPLPLADARAAPGRVGAPRAEVSAAEVAGPCGRGVEPSVPTNSG